MATTDCATDTGLADVQNENETPPPAGASKPLKGLIIGFAVTVSSGLALASWYVGARIVSADEAVPSSPPIHVQVSAPVQVQATAPPHIQVSAPAIVPAPPVPAPAVVVPLPPPPELYLQVAGLGIKQDVGYVRSLRAKGFHAHIQDSDRADDGQILIGPFASNAEMKRAQRKLQSAGVLAVEAER